MIPDGAILFKILFYQICQKYSVHWINVLIQFTISLNDSNTFYVDIIIPDTP